MASTVRRSHMFWKTASSCVKPRPDPDTASPLYRRSRSNHLPRSRRYSRTSAGEKKVLRSSAIREWRREYHRSFSAPPVGLENTSDFVDASDNPDV